VDLRTLALLLPAAGFLPDGRSMLKDDPRVSRAGVISSHRPFTRLQRLPLRKGRRGKVNVPGLLLRSYLRHLPTPVRSLATFPSCPKHPGTINASARFASRTTNPEAASRFSLPSRTFPSFGIVGLNRSPAPETHPNEQPGLPPLPDGLRFQFPPDHRLGSVSVRQALQF
jgi:hypothetical protein